MRLDYFTIKRKRKNPKRTGKALRKLEIYKKPTFTYDLQSVMKGKKCWHFPDCKRFSHMGKCKE